MKVLLYINIIIKLSFDDKNYLAFYKMVGRYIDNCKNNRGKQIAVKLNKRPFFTGAFYMPYTLAVL